MPFVMCFVLMTEFTNHTDQCAIISAYIQKKNSESAIIDQHTTLFKMYRIPYI